MNTVYVETSVIGHLASRPHPDPIVAARQTITRQWWPAASSRYRLLISQLVLDECSGGDPEAARERRDVIEGFETLEVNDAVLDLAKRLLTA